MPTKQRLDLLIVERGLAADRSLAQRLVMAGKVRVGGQLVLQPATPVAKEALIQVEPGPRYVSRGGEKLEAALHAFRVGVADRICADVGASTGGFTDCLLQHGARLVYAIDVGQGILDWKLRQDQRVVVMENTNARYVKRLLKPVSLVTIDAAFISLKVLLPVVLGWLPTEIDESEPASGERPQGDILALVKPQFEASRTLAGRARGVIRDAQVHRQVLLEMLAFARRQGCQVNGLIASPLLGIKGNREFIAWFSLPAGMETPQSEFETLVESALSSER